MGAGESSPCRWSNASASDAHWTMGRSHQKSIGSFAWGPGAAEKNSLVLSTCGVQELLRRDAWEHGFKGCVLQWYIRIRLCTRRINGLSTSPSHERLGRAEFLKGNDLLASQLNLIIFHVPFSTTDIRGQQIISAHPRDGLGVF